MCQASDHYLNNPLTRLGFLEVMEITINRKKWIYSFIHCSEILCGNPSVFDTVGSDRLGSAKRNVKLKTEDWGMKRSEEVLETSEPSNDDEIG